MFKPNFRQTLRRPGAVSAFYSTFSVDGNTSFELNSATDGGVMKGWDHLTSSLILTVVLSARKTSAQRIKGVHSARSLRALSRIRKQQDNEDMVLG